MKNLPLIALGLLMVSCASHKSATGPSPAPDAEFPSSISGRAFFTKPVDISVEGEPSEFGRSPADTLWLNAIRGGVSRADYRYFLFRVPSLAGLGRVDIVFFNDDAKGFFVPVDIAHPTESASAAFTLYLKSGGGEAYTSKSTLRGAIRTMAGGSRISVSLDCVNKLSALFIPAGQREWRSHMVFTEASVPATILQAARTIAGTITKERPNKAPEPTTMSVTSPATQEPRQP